MDASCNVFIFCFIFSNFLLSIILRNILYSIPLVVTSDVTGYAFVVDSSAVDETAKTDNCNYLKKK
jgi:hypothetical protein